MVNPQWVGELEIVGYGNVLDATMLPLIVAPVFRLAAEPDRFFLPPYVISAGYLCNAAELRQEEVQRLHDRQEVTLFDQSDPIAAQGGSELWIDQEFRPHYELREKVKEDLAKIAEEHIALAKRALLRSELDQADRLASVAMAADSQKVGALVVKGAIRKRRGNVAGFRLMMRLAQRSVGEAEFKLLVTAVLASCKPIAAATSVGPLSQAATYRNVGAGVMQ